MSHQSFSKNTEPHEHDIAGCMDCECCAAPHVTDKIPCTCPAVSKSFSKECTDPKCSAHGELIKLRADLDACEKGLTGLSAALSAEKADHKETAAILRRAITAREEAVRVEMGLRADLGVAHMEEAKAVLRADKAEQERDEARANANAWDESCQNIGLLLSKAEARAVKAETKCINTLARVTELEAGINAVVESVDALNDGGWTDLIAGAFDKFSRDLRALTEKEH